MPLHVLGERRHCCGHLRVGQIVILLIPGGAWEAQPRIDSCGQNIDPNID
jgi:hypothetical protein